MKKTITIMLDICSWLLLFLVVTDDFPYFEKLLLISAIPFVHTLQSIHSANSFSELLHSNFHLRKVTHITSVLIFLVSVVLFCVAPIQDFVLLQVLLPHTWAQLLIPIAGFLLTVLNMLIYLHDLTRRERGLSL